jgi:hypothetical protein
MPIQYTCPCGRRLQAREEHAGRLARCPACGAETSVPTTDTDRPAPAPPGAGAITAEVPDATSGEDRFHDTPRGRRPGDARPGDEAGRPAGPWETSGKAVAALVLGLASFCLGPFTGLPAVLLALLSFRDVRAMGGRLGGTGLAVAGLVCGCLGTLLFLWVGYGIYTGVRNTNAHRTVAADLQQFGIAMHNHSDATGHLPTAAAESKAGKPQLSWRVQLLPYLEQDNLYRQFRQDEPWDGPHNRAFVTAMPRVFAHPKHPDESARGLTYFRVFTGEKTPFPSAKPIRMGLDFADGTSNTILVVEAAEPVPWTKPDELEFDRTRPLPKLGGHFKSGFHAGMADGSVHFVRSDVSEATLRNAIDICDGNVLGPDW